MGGVLCCCRRAEIRPSFRDVAGSSPTRHHSQAHATQIKYVGALPALTISDQEPQGRDSSPRRLSQEAQKQDSSSNNPSRRPSQEAQEPDSQEPDSGSPRRPSQEAQEPDSASPRCPSQQAQEPDSGPRRPSQEAHEPDYGSNMRRFFFSELQQATDNFNEDWVVGYGGFGKVFKAELSDGMKIAVKRRNPDSRQGRNEFLTEIKLCSGLNHNNVVSLLGFCDEGDEMLLVYEYVGQGHLASHLYGSRASNSHLTWQRRVEILIGAATGLHYLHTCSEKGIIHRDMKSSNILLDDNHDAKIADFGLSKIGPAPDKTHVTTEVKGTFGYFDLDYVYSKQVTPASDVYAFGVVMLEALCARKAVNEQLPVEEWSLALWAMKNLKDQGHLQDIIDQRIKDTIEPNSLKKFTKLVQKCLVRNHKRRPLMENVISELTVVWELQTGRMMLPEDDGDDSSGPCSPPVPMFDFSEDDSSTVFSISSLTSED